MAKQIISDDVAKRVVLSHDALAKRMLLEKKIVARKTKIIRDAIAQLEEAKNGQS